MGIFLYVHCNKPCLTEVLSPQKETDKALSPRPLTLRAGIRETGSFTHQLSVVRGEILKL